MIIYFSHSVFIAFTRCHNSKKPDQDGNILFAQPVMHVQSVTAVRNLIIMTKDVRP